MKNANSQPTLNIAHPCPTFAPPPLCASPVLTFQDNRKKLVNKCHIGSLIDVEKNGVVARGDVNDTFQDDATENFDVGQFESHHNRVDVLTSSKDDDGTNLFAQLVERDTTDNETDEVSYEESFSVHEEETVSSSSSGREIVDDLNDTTVQCCLSNDGPVASKVVADKEDSAAVYINVVGESGNKGEARDEHRGKVEVCIVHPSEMCNEECHGSNDVEVSNKQQCETETKNVENTRKSSCTLNLDKMLSEIKQLRKDRKEMLRKLEEMKSEQTMDLSVTYNIDVTEMHRQKVNDDSEAIVYTNVSSSNDELDHPIIPDEGHTNNSTNQISSEVNTSEEKPVLIAKSNTTDITNNNKPFSEEISCPMCKITLNTNNRINFGVQMHLGLDFKVDGSETSEPMCPVWNVLDDDNVRFEIFQILSDENLIDDKRQKYKLICETWKRRMSSEKYSTSNEVLNEAEKFLERISVEDREIAMDLASRHDDFPKEYDKRRKTKTSKDRYIHEDPLSSKTLNIDETYSFESSHKELDHNRHLGILDRQTTENGNEIETDIVVENENDQMKGKAKFDITLNDDNNLPSQRRLPAIHLAAIDGNFKILQYLVKDFDEYSSCDVRVKGGLIHSCQYTWPTDCIAASPVCDDVKPIHLVAAFGHLDCLKWMIKEKRLSPNIATQRLQLTPLHLASIFGHYKIVRWLSLSSGRNINSDNKDYHYSTKHTETVDLNAIDVFGKDAIFYAKKQNNIQVSEFLHKMIDCDFEYNNTQSKYKSLTSSSVHSIVTITEQKYNASEDQHYASENIQPQCLKSRTQQPFYLHMSDGEKDSNYASLDTTDTIKLIDNVENQHDVSMVSNGTSDENHSPETDHSEIKFEVPNGVKTTDCTDEDVGQPMSVPLPPPLPTSALTFSFKNDSIPLSAGEKQQKPTAVVKGQRHGVAAILPISTSELKSVKLRHVELSPVEKDVANQQHFMVTDVEIETKTERKPVKCERTVSLPVDFSDEKKLKEVPSSIEAAKCDLIEELRQKTRQTGRTTAISSVLKSKPLKLTTTHHDGGDDILKKEKIGGRVKINRIHSTEFQAENEESNMKRGEVNSSGLHPDWENYLEKICKVDKKGNVIPEWKLKIMANKAAHRNFSSDAIH